MEGLNLNKGLPTTCNHNGPQQRITGVNKQMITCTPV